MSLKENIIQQKSFYFAVRAIVEANSLLEDATEICKILAKIKITMKKDN